MLKDIIKINHGTLDTDELKQVSNLLNLVFPKQNYINYDYLNWLYKKNPEGKAITYNAIYNGKIIAHYAVIPVTYILFNEKVRGCLSLNTAVIDKYNRMGIFTKLANKTYKTAFDLGYEYIFAIANAASTPGFLKKLNFQFVGALDVYFKHKFNLSYNLNKYVSTSYKEFHFYNHWDSKKFYWRVTKPNAKYKYHNSDSYKLYNPTNLYGLDVCLFEFIDDIDMSKILKELNLPKVRNLFPIYMWIGLNGNTKNRLLNLPKYFKPSPLNLVFKDLTKRNRVLDSDKVKISVLDFDAY